MPSDVALRVKALESLVVSHYGLAALLIGARLDEKAFAEGRGPNPASQGHRPWRAMNHKARPLRF